MTGANAVTRGHWSVGENFSPSKFSSVQDRVRVVLLASTIVGSLSACRVHSDSVLNAERRTHAKPETIGGPVPGLTNGGFFDEAMAHRYNAERVVPQLRVLPHGGRCVARMATWSELPLSNVGGVCQGWPAAENTADAVLAHASLWRMRAVELPMDSVAQQTTEMCSFRGSDLPCRSYISRAGSSDGDEELCWYGYSLVFASDMQLTYLDAANLLLATQPKWREVLMSMNTGCGARRWVSTARSGALDVQMYILEELDAGSDQSVEEFGWIRDLHEGRISALLGEVWAVRTVDGVALALMDSECVAQFSDGPYIPDCALPDWCAGAVGGRRMSLELTDFAVCRLVDESEVSAWTNDPNEAE